MASTRLLDAPGARDAFLSRLTQNERNRYETFASEKRRREFLVSRALVRNALLQWAGGGAQAWRIADRRGRPVVEARQGETVPSISWSHSGEHVVCALCERGDVGIDVESLRVRDVDALAEAVCAPSERAYLQRQAGPDQLGVFYRFWTLKEAYTKALGTGLATPFRDVVFRWWGGPVELLQGAHAGERELHGAMFAPAPGTIAALILLVEKADEIPSSPQYFLMRSFNDVTAVAADLFAPA